MIRYRVDPTAPISGTHFLGCLPIPTSYDRLIEVLGPPSYEDGDGTQAEWLLQFEDGRVATIYDWREVRPVHEVIAWHVGGFSETGVLALVQQVIAEAIKPSAEEVPS